MQGFYVNSSLELIAPKDHSSGSSLALSTSSFVYLRIEQLLSCQTETPDVLYQRRTVALIIHVRDVDANSLENCINCCRWGLKGIVEDPVVSFMPDKVDCGREQESSNQMSNVILLCIYV
jgi:hypothetical protein